MKPPDFLQKSFVFHANVWCEKEACIRRHELELVNHDNNFISYWKVCQRCEETANVLRTLGISKDNARIADRMPITEWVFLILHPEDIIA